jgi:uncharacterized protein
MKSYSFDEAHVLHELKHFLPSQGPIKDFIHHNTLHALQNMRFYDAVFQGATMFGFLPTLQLNDFRKLYSIGRIREDILNNIISDKKGKNNISLWREKLLSNKYDTQVKARIGQLRSVWKKDYHIDLDNLVQPLLFRIICSYLDQGIALWHFPFEDKGLINALRIVEKNSFSSFFRTKRAKKLLFEDNLSIEKLLKIVVGNEVYYEQYLFDQQFSHRGWSGIAAAIEAQPNSILYPKKIELKDVILLDLLLEIDALDATFGEKWSPLCTNHREAPINLFAPVPKTELQEVLTLWQDAFEWSYYDEVLAGVTHLNQQKKSPTDVQNTEGGNSFQAVFCIDERECSLRRHVEFVDKHSETLGCPGFFGVEFYFQPEGGKFYDKLCPAPVTPKFLIKETHNHGAHDHDFIYTKKTHTTFQGFFLSLSLGVWAAIKLTLHLFRPKMTPAISDAFAHMEYDSILHIENKGLDKVENGLQVGFTVQEMATRAENLLRGIGLVKDFAPIVYLVSHGSSSANNPHHGAHDCGACSGRPGATNARVMAFMINHKEVRAILAKNGLIIPDETQFIGSMHDTAADQMGFYDENILSEKNKERHRNNVITFEEALDLNAKERSRRFASINTKAEIKKVREEIRKRSVSMFEPRPELGHGTNALCFVGKRSLTKGLFLDRRAFMNSYDCTTDPEGKLLLNVIRPLPVVCGGINLEYYFSRVDNQKMGCGTKLPHNVMGLIGVANSSDGDLRPGLPWQMIEPHDPVRLMIIVEHYPDIVLKTIQSDASLYEWFENEWVHLTVIHPETMAFYYFKNGQFDKYVPLTSNTNKFEDIHQFIERAPEMETNHIAHATQENLPIHIIETAN